MVIFRSGKKKGLVAEGIFMDTMSSEELARRIEALGYTEEAARIEEVYNEVPLYSQNL